MSSLFQANLAGSDVGGGPREVSMFHSVITLKNQGLSGGLYTPTFKHSQKVQNNNKLLLMVTKIQTTIGFSKELEDNLIMILLVTPLTLNIFLTVCM